MANAKEEKKLEKVIGQLAELGISIEAGIEGFPALTGEETLEDLQAMLAKVKGDEPEPAPTTPAPKAKKATSTVFTFKNGATREFSEAIHGEKWSALADEFQETNKISLASRDAVAI